MSYAFPDAVFTTHYRTVDIPTITTPINIAPIGDMHFHSRACDTGRLNAALRYMKKLPGVTLPIIMGDEIEATSASERKALRSVELHDSSESRMDDSYKQSCRELLEKFEWARGNILGWIQGNHDYTFYEEDKEAKVIRAQTSSEWMAKESGAPWLGYLAYIRLGIRVVSSNNFAHLDIVACHGKAGGKLVGTDINQVDDLRKIFPAADLFLMGHSHGKGAVPTSSLYAHTDIKNHTIVIKQKEQYLGRTGSFLKGYEPNKRSYVVGSLLRPSVLGTILFKVRLMRKDRPSGGQSMEIQIRAET
jgi:hypothetical protein